MRVMTKGPQGDDIVMLSRTEYDQLVAAANEDTRDAETLRRSIACVSSGEEETFTSAEVDAFLAAKTPLAFFRKKRGMSQDDLAKRASITQGYLSEIEIGRKSGDVRTLRMLADALKVSLDSLARGAERGRHQAPRCEKEQSLARGSLGAMNRDIVTHAVLASIIAGGFCGAPLLDMGEPPAHQDKYKPRLLASLHSKETTR
jgi:transcriptional regulator with XRE-family HTH domain